MIPMHLKTLRLRELRSYNLFRVPELGRGRARLELTTTKLGAREALSKQDCLRLG